MASDDLTRAVKRGDRRAQLEAIRDRLAAELVTAEGGVVAVLAKELRAVLAELDALPSAGRESKLDRLAGAVADDLAAKRAARRADAEGAAGT